MRNILLKHRRKVLKSGKGLRLEVLLVVYSEKRRGCFEGGSRGEEGKWLKGMMSSTCGCLESGQIEKQELSGPLKATLPIASPHYLLLYCTRYLVSKALAWFEPIKGRIVWFISSG